MRESRISRLSLQLFTLDLFLTPVGLLVATRLRSWLPLGRGGALPEEAVVLPWYVFLLAVVCWSGGLLMASAYDPQRVLRWYNEAVHVIWGGAIGTVLMAGGLFIAFREMSRLQFIYFFVINLMLLLGHRAAFRVYYRLIGRERPGWRSRILIVGAGVLGQRLAQVLLDHSRWGYILVGYVDDASSKQGQTFEGARVLGTLDAMRQVVEAHNVEELWVALPVRAFERLNFVVVEAETLPVRVKIAPDYLSLAMVRAQVETLAGIPLIGLREPVITGIARMAKRAMDVVIAGLSFLVAAPFLLIVAVAIRLETKGPALFRQKRLGENGRLFDMLKFRTMVADAEARQGEVITKVDTGELVHKRRDDPRVTRVGRLLRRFSLDELPQLINVLRGDMSLVGPRPELPWLVDKYKPWQRKRFAVPQGITGWWQIGGRSDKPMHLNTDDDLYYVYNYSLWLDLWILLRTPLAVLRGTGAF
jgi:exopolysaccharide biosynthesis polyprenyl glycosylphosphotransferase